MRKLALLVLLCPLMALAQVQVSGSAVQIGGNVPNVTAINGASGSFTFQGPGVSCIDTTCTFTGAITLTTNGRSGIPALSDEGVLNIPAYGGGNVFQNVNTFSLVGAFTDSSGNVIQPIAPGNGPSIYAVPFGATQLQLGVNDNVLSDNTGSWVIDVNGTHYTVASTKPAWMHTAGINSQYPTNPDTTGPVIASIGAQGTYVTITYVSGTVSSGTGACGLSSSNYDASGQPGCALSFDGTNYLPGFWAMPSPISASAPVWGTFIGTLSAQTDLQNALNLKAPLASPALSGVPTAPTATPGTNTTQLATTAFVIANGGSGTPGGSNGNLQYNNSGAFGGDASTTDDGSGNVTVKTLSTAGAGAGAVSLAQGSAASNATTSVTLTVPTSVTSYRVQLPGAHATGSDTFLSCTAADPSVCTWAAGGGGSSSSGVFPVDSYGCVADGNVSANTGTDNTSCYATAYAAAVANGGGTLTWDCAKQYRFLTTGPTIVDSNISWASTTPGCMSRIFTSSSSATIGDVHGTNSTTTISSNSITDIRLSRAVAPATNSIGLLLHFAPLLTVANSWVDDSAVCYDVTYIGSGGLGGLYHNVCAAGFDGVAQGATPYTGWVLDGAATGFVSLLGDYNVFSINPAVITTSATTGTLLKNQLQDLWWEHFTVANGVQVGIDTSTPTVGQNVHILFPELDDVAVDAIRISGLDANSLDISGSGWGTVANFAGQTAGIELISTGGVTIRDFHFYDNSAKPIIYMHGTNPAHPNVIQNNRFDLVHTGAQAISMNTVGGANITDNTIDAFGHTLSNPAIQLVSSSFSQLKTNLLTNGAGTGISLDASSNSNCCTNLNTLITFTTSDAGSGNAFASSISALTMNNSGSGVSSGTTFDGATARTLSYNTLGAAPTASPTFTGTPDASGATQFKLPVAASGASAANGELIYDSTNKNWHGWVNGADTIFVPLASGFTTGHCGQPTLHTNTWSIDDAGGACGVSGGGAAFSAITAGTNANALVMGTGGSLDVSGSGTINATKVGGITITGTPSTGNVPTATSSSTATWQAAGGGNYVNLCSLVTLTNATCSSGTISVTASSSSFTISAIPGTYINLRVTSTVKDSSLAEIDCQFNADTAGNYAFQKLQLGGGASAPSNSGSGNASSTSIGCGDAGTLTGGGTMVIPFYAGSLPKMVLADSFLTDSVSSGTNIIGVKFQGAWNSTAAITSIKFIPSAGTFSAGTSYAIYGEN